MYVCMHKAIRDRRHEMLSSDMLTSKGIEEDTEFVLHARDPRRNCSTCVQMQRLDVSTWRHTETSTQLAKDRSTHGTVTCVDSGIDGHFLVCLKYFSSNRSKLAVEVICTTLVCLQQCTRRHTRVLVTALHLEHPCGRFDLQPIDWSTNDRQHGPQHMSASHTGWCRDGSRSHPAPPSYTMHRLEIASHTDK